MAKVDMVAGEASGLRQSGGALLPDVQIPWPLPVEIGLGSIDTFTLSPDGTIEPAGVDADIAEAWFPAVRSLAEAVSTSADRLGIEFAGDAYITASSNEAADVSHEPHFDDDMLTADEGVGLVAIVGQLCGPRVAVGSLPLDGAVETPTQLPLDPTIKQRFDDNEVPAQHVGAEQVVIFPGFAQLHSGPRLAEDSTEPRLLLVLRAQTVPAGEATEKPAT